MVDKFLLSFIPTGSAIRDPVTKFGGQPVWLTGSQWPRSRTTGNPMRFICQIDLQQFAFTTVSAMAYVFMTDEKEYVDGTWDPDLGENAVVIQSSPVRVDTPTEDGPTLFQMVRREGEKKSVRQPVEFAVGTTRGVDPTTEELNEEPPESFENKIGGSPVFVQYDQTPKGGYDLLLQLDSTAPFWINFAGAGVGYIFISKDRTIGKFLWQS